MVISTENKPASDLWLLLAAGAALLAGTWLRFSALAGQAPFHDEWHVLFDVHRLGLLGLASGLGPADRSVPIALLLKLLALGGLLDDRILWYPFALSGLLSILFLHRLIRRRFGSSPALLIDILLLVSPLLVYYSRTARPYVFAGPLATASLFAFHEWLEGGAARELGIWLAVVVLVGWSMPVYVPFLLAPVVFAGCFAVFHREPTIAGRRPKEVLRTGVLAVFMLSIVLVPPIVLGFSNLSSKLESSPFSAASVTAGFSFGLAFGSTALSWGLVGIAAVFLLAPSAPQPRLRLTIVSAILVQLLFLLSVRPRGLSSLLVSARYQLPSIVALCAVACIALDRAAGRSRIRRALLGGSMLALVAIVWVPRLSVCTGSPDNFRSTKLFQAMFAPPSTLVDAISKLPPAYREVTARRGRFAILEVPYNGYLKTPYPYYQRLHGHEVYLGVERGSCTAADTRELPPDGSEGFRLSRFVALSDLSGMRRRGVRFIVLHRDPEFEVPWLREEKWRRDRFDYEGCVNYLRHRTGLRPTESVGVSVFDLSKMEESGRAPQSGSRITAP